MRTPKERVAKDGTVSYQIKFRNQGVYTSETFRLRKDAVTFAAHLDGGGPPAALDWLAARSGKAAPKTVLTFATWFEEYVNQLTGVTSRTRDDYRNIHRRYLTHLDGLPLEHITRTHVTAIVNNMESRGLSPKTIKNTIHLLSGVMSLAVDEGHIVRSPTKRVRLPRQNKNVDQETRFLTGQEFADLLAATPEHYQPLMKFLVGTGMRWSEATAVQWRHVNFDAGTIHVRQAWKRIKGGWELGPPKSPKARRTVNPSAMALAAIYPNRGNPDEFVFTTPLGNVVRHGNFYSRIWVPSCIRAGLTDPRPSPHDCRHTHASWLLSRGASLFAVQDQLGHESPETTRKIYAHLLPAVGVELGLIASAAMEESLAQMPAPLKELEA